MDDNTVPRMFAANNSDEIIHFLIGNNEFDSFFKDNTVSSKFEAQSGELMGNQILKKQGESWFSQNDFKEPLEWSNSFKKQVKICVTLLNKLNEQRRAELCYHYKELTQDRLNLLSCLEKENIFFGSIERFIKVWKNCLGPPLEEKTLFHILDFNTPKEIIKIHKVYLEPQQNKIEAENARQFLYQYKCRKTSQELKKDHVKHLLTFMSFRKLELVNLYSLFETPKNSKLKQ